MPLVLPPLWLRQWLTAEVRVREIRSSAASEAWRSSVRSALLPLYFFKMEAPNFSFSLWKSSNGKKIFGQFFDNQKLARACASYPLYQDATCELHICLYTCRRSVSVPVWVDKPGRCVGGGRGSLVIRRRREIRSGTTPEAWWSSTRSARTNGRPARQHPRGGRLFPSLHV